MSVFHYLKRHGALLAELEALRAANDLLQRRAETAEIRSWIHCPDPQAHRRGRDPHPVHPSRHRDDQAVTEHHRRAAARRNP